MKKEEIRRKYKKVRKNVSNKDELSFLITNKIKTTNEYKCANIVCIYLNLEDEVDTSYIIRDALDSGKIVGVPIIYNSCMQFYKIQSLDEEMKINHFGIREPIKNSDYLISPSSINLFIIPGICFDLENNRVGFGGGYYDKYLGQSELNAFKIGICYKKQISVVDVIEVDDFDIKMDLVIHE